MTVICNYIIIISWTICVFKPYYENTLCVPKINCYCLTVFAYVYGTIALPNNEIDKENRVYDLLKAYAFACVFRNES